MRLNFVARVFLSISVLMCGCGSVEKASQHYRQHRDYASLNVLSNHLHKGIPRKEVEDLLGEPDYSPTEGQYHYVSDPKDEYGMTHTLVVQYFRTHYGDDEIVTEHTGSLGWFKLFPTGE